MTRKLSSNVIEVLGREVDDGLKLPAILPAYWTLMDEAQSNQEKLAVKKAFRHATYRRKCMQWLQFVLVIFPVALIGVFCFAVFWKNANPKEIGWGIFAIWALLFFGMAICHFHDARRIINYVENFNRR